MKKILLVLLLVISIFLFVSCNNEEIIEQDQNENINIDDNTNNDNKEDDLKIETPQEPLVSADHELILNDFKKSKYFEDGNNYEIKNVFAIYGNSIIVEIVNTNMNLIDTSFAMYGIDDAWLVIPGGYSKGSHYVLAYNQGEFCLLNQAIDNELLKKADILDLKVKFDKYYYNNDLWYERVALHHYTVIDAAYPPILEWEDYYIDKGILSKTTTNTNIIDYKVKQADYEKIMELFYAKFNITDRTYVIEVCFGNINGAIVVGINYPITTAEYSEIPYQIGNYKFAKNYRHSDLYIYINDKLYSLEEAYNEHVIDDYAVRLIAFHIYVKGFYLFYANKFYIEYPLQIIE